MTKPQVPRARASHHTAVRAAGSRFIVVEGLSAVGKSAVAPLVAQRLGARLVQTPAFDEVRLHIDRLGSAPARLHFWMMRNYAVSESVRNYLAAGCGVVVESYFYRTLATHAAMGVKHLPAVDWDRAARPDLAVLLTVNELQRQWRLAERQRTRGLSYWSRLEEFNVDVTRRAYESFGLTVLDTTGLNEAQVADRVTTLADSPDTCHR